MTNREDTNIWPNITVDDALALRAWLVSLGFEEGICVPGELDGSVMHSEMLWPEGGRLTVAGRGGMQDPTFEVPPGSAGVYVVTQDPAAVWARARALGATVVREMEDTDYGSTGFSIRDAEGNTYSFGTYAGRED